MIEGYASVFYDGTPETEYRLGTSGGQEWIERIDPTAFNAALQRDDVYALYNHNSMLGILGRTSAGTLRLSVDARGLRYEITDGTTNLHKDVTESQQRGDLRGSSFGFNIDDQVISRTKDKVIRTVKSVTLFDVGPVSMPAYSGTESGDGRCRRSVSNNLQTFNPARYECRSAVSDLRRALVSMRLKEIEGK